MTTNVATEPTIIPGRAGTGDDTEGLAEFPAPFGHYLLLHPLARGGMGNVFLAKTGGMMGIEKHCVVKTLRSRFTGDPEYVQRFVDEARVVVQLTHRNICPVFDVGRVGDSYYLAMELVIGRDVRTLHSEQLQHGKHLPEACILHIVSEMLDALDYAHRHADPVSGEPLHLVHRDVSPQNVMINVEGEVKLIDFGLAEKGRAVEGQEEIAGTHSQATVMGKIAYMSPEHARGDPVDARADQFAAAVVAYELLTEERYYEGMSNQEVWMTAGTGTYRAPAMDKLDPALRTVLERALAPAKHERYPSCGEFREAILGYARMKDLHAGARDLREIMGALFADDLRGTRELLQRFAHISSQARPGYSAPGPASAPPPDAIFSIATSVHAKQIHDPTEIFPRSGIFEMPKKRSRVLPVAAAAVVLAVIGVGIGMMAADTGGDVVVQLPPPPPPTVAPQPPVPAPTPPPVVTPPAAPTTEPVAAKDPPRRPRPPPRRADPTSLPAKEQIAWVKKQCGQLTCSKSLSSDELTRLTQGSDLVSLKTYRERISACVKACNK